MLKKRWKDQEERLLIENSIKLSIEELAKMFGVSEKSIADKIRRLRRKKPESLAQDDVDTVEPEEVTSDTESLDLELEERVVVLNEEKVIMVPAGFLIKTEEGWKEFLMKKR